MPLTEKQCRYLASLVEREMANFPPDFVEFTPEEESERMLEFEELHAALRPGWHHIDRGASQYWTSEHERAPWYRRFARRIGLSP